MVTRQEVPHLRFQNHFGTGGFHGVAGFPPCLGSQSALVHGLGWQSLCPLAPGLGSSCAGGSHRDYPQPLPGVLPLASRAPQCDISWRLSQGVETETWNKVGPSQEPQHLGLCAVTFPTWPKTGLPNKSESCPIGCGTNMGTKPSPILGTSSQKPASRGLSPSWRCDAKLG